MLVRLLLVNRFQLFLWWGPHFCQIYNNASRPVLGEKHPKSMGQAAAKCWAEIWHIIGPLIQTPFQGGDPTWMDDIFLDMNRYGYTEETHFTIAYSPVPDSTVPSGIGGVLGTVHEITEKVVAERRVKVLRDLGYRSAEAKTAEDACSISAGILAQHPNDVPFGLLYLVDPDKKQASLAGTAGIDAGTLDSPHIVELSSDFDGKHVWPLAQVWNDRKMRIVENLSDRLSKVPAGPWSTPPSSAVVLPVGHECSDLLVLGISSLLRFDDNYRGFFELVAGQVATAIANARSYEAERKRAEALAEIDRAKTAFFSNVSHEFRTPLTLMLGPLEDILSSESDANLPHRDDLAVVHRNGLRLLKLVNSLLDFSRIEAGRADASYQLTDISSLTADLASSFRSAMEREGLRYDINCGPTVDDIFVDRDMWEKIVLNLISNAFKFTFEGTVRVSVTSADNFAHLEVIDTGTGIPAQELPHLFERFHRVAGARGRTYEGTGIGLALVQELVKLHGGSIAVRSEEGKGSSFIVMIPKGKGHLPEDRIDKVRTFASSAIRADSYVEEALRWLPSAPAEHNGPAPLMADPTGHTVSALVRDHEYVGPPPLILLADDNADMRDYIRRLLAGSFRVEDVSNGMEALRAARDLHPDLVLTDIMMPVLDGFGVLRALRNDPATRAIPVILLSARAGEESRLEGLHEGADDYLVKPFTGRELLARVEAHLKVSRVRTEAARLERDLRAEIETERNRLRESEVWLAGQKEAFQAAVNSAPLKTSLAVLIRTAIEQIGDGARCAFFIANASETELHHVTGMSDTYAKDVDGFKIGSDSLACGLAVYNRQPVITSDVREEPRWRQWLWLAQKHGYRGIWSFPVETSAGKVVGTFAMYFEEPRQATSRDQEFAGVLTHAASIIISRQQESEALLESEDRYRSLAGTLESQVRDRTRDLEERNAEILRQAEQVRELTAQLLRAQDVEQRRLALELHDGAGQWLVALKWKLGSLTQQIPEQNKTLTDGLEDSLKLLDSLSQELRTVSHLLHPPLLEDAGLRIALQQYADGILERSGLAVELQIDPNLKRLPPDVERTVFRIVQEALTNVHRHAKTKSSVVRISTTSMGINVDVEDKGQGITGFKSLDDPSAKLGVGIRGMQERVRQLRGKLDLQSSPYGTKVSMFLPTQPPSLSLGIDA
jgi:signal transduction histidine kinase/CheY-like chemotaxis protein